MQAVQHDGIATDHVSCVKRVKGQLAEQNLVDAKRIVSWLVALRRFVYNVGLDALVVVAGTNVRRSTRRTSCAYGIRSLEMSRVESRRNNANLPDNVFATPLAASRVDLRLDVDAAARDLFFF